MSVRVAVELDLKDLESRLKGVSDTALAATALVLADELDGEASATAKANCARALTETMGQLVALVPAAAAEDELDAIRKRRRKKQSAG